LQPRAEGLAFPIWSYLSCYPARFMASPPFLRHLCRAAHKRALFDYLNAITTWRFAEQRSKLGNMDCERRLNIPHSAVIPPSTNSRAPVTEEGSSGGQKKNGGGAPARL